LHEKASAGIIIASQGRLRGFFALFIANSVPMVYEFNSSLEKRPMARSQRLIEGRGDFMNDFISKKSPLPPLLLKGGYKRGKT